MEVAGPPKLLRCVATTVAGLEKAIMRTGALAAILLWAALLLAGLSLTMKLGADIIPTFLTNQDYWLAMGAFLVLLMGTFACRSPQG